jgi:hypothetical protein
MPVSEHRIAPRFKLHAPMFFHRVETSSEEEHKANTINISIHGIYFATEIFLQVGESVEILLGMPARVMGARVGIRRFLGRVTHIESMDAVPGISGIGVHLLYFERVIRAHRIKEATLLFTS